MTDLRTLRLIRHKQTEWATFGRLYAHDGTEICVTCERPWVDKDADGKRDRGVSRIAPATYTVKRRLDSPKHGEVFELQDVPDATNIQIHAANWPTQLEGCIAVGSAFGEVTIGKVTAPGVTGSKMALAKFMREMQDVDTFLLTIVDSFR